MAARLFAYVVDLIVSLNVPNVYSFLPICSHRNRSF